MKNLLFTIFVIFSLSSVAQTSDTLFVINNDTLFVPHGFKIDSVKTLVDGSHKVYLSEIKIFGNEYKHKVLTFKSSSDPDLEIDGLLIDETKTKSGRDFYEYFYKDWTPPVGVKNYMIFISERPYRLNNTLIEIKINETLVFQQFLQRRDEFVENLAKEAAQRVYIYLLQYNTLIKQLNGNDMNGNGIY